MKNLFWLFFILLILILILYIFWFKFNENKQIVLKTNLKAPINLNFEKIKKGDSCFYNKDKNYFGQLRIKGKVYEFKINQYNQFGNIINEFSFLGSLDKDKIIGILSDDKEGNIKSELIYFKNKIKLNEFELNKISCSQYIKKINKLLDKSIKKEYLTYIDGSNSKIEIQCRKDTDCIKTYRLDSSCGTPFAVRKDSLNWRNISEFNKVQKNKNWDKTENCNLLEDYNKAKVFCNQDLNICDFKFDY